MSAFFGVGFIAGPVLGGLAGMISLRAPFYFAAALNLIAAVVCTAVLPESRKPVADALPTFRLRQLNPVASLISIRKLHGLSGLLSIFCVMVAVGQVPSVLWVLYGTARFGWSSAMVGVSFAVFGLFHALCQAFLPGPVQKRFGKTGSVLTGMVAESVGFSIYSLARSTAAAMAVIPFLSMGGIAEPAMQSLLTGSVPEERQGELQGVLTSISSLIFIGGPIATASLYSFLQRRLPGYPGAIWLCALVFYPPCVAVLLSQKRRIDSPNLIVAASGSEEVASS